MKKRNKSNYRKIYEQYHGSIPKDSDGRTFDIHHIDGDPTNDVINNLIALSIQDHYNIHYTQGDWGACIKIKARMNLSPEEISELVSNRNKKKWNDGTHVLIGYNEKRISEGTHNWIGSKHHNKRLEEGTHNWVQEWTCEHCGKSGKNLSLFTRWGHHDGSCLGPKKFLPANTDLNVYCWKNKCTGEIVNMTRHQLSRTYGIRPQDIYNLITKRRKSTGGWTLV
jgi:hypothetical protein